jgi:hypothetical protein
MRRALAAGALVFLVACGGNGGRASSTTTTTLALGGIPAQSADPTATDTDNGGRAFARLYAANVKQQSHGAVDDTQTQCIEDQLVAKFGGERLLQLANTTYKTMLPADLQTLEQVLQGCGLTAATLDTLGVTASS